MADTRIARTQRTDLAEPGTPRLDPYDVGPTASQRRALWIVIAVLVVVAIVSEFALRPYFTSADAWGHQVASLTEKQGNVTTLAASTAGASGAITLLPGDIGTPIAEQLAGLSSDLVVVLAAVYLEKYLLTILSLVTFGFLLPIGCGMGVGACAMALRGQADSLWCARLTNLAAKLVVYGVALVLVIPASVALSDLVEATYEEASNATIAETAQQLDEGAQQVQENSSSDSDDSTSSNLLESIGSAISSGVSSLTSGAQSALDGLTSTLDRAMEAFAVMVVTSCLIPILVMLLFFWLTKLFTGVDLSVPTRAGISKLKGATHKQLPRN